jgi:hypothetical protein
MGSTNLISVNQAAVGAGASWTVRPPVGEAWEINIVGSDQAFVTGVPDVEIHYTDGAKDAIMVLDPTTDPGKRRLYKFIITRDVYLSIKNTAAGAAVLSVSGKKVNPFNARAGIVTLGAGGTYDLDPGTTAIRVFEMGGSVWTVGPADVNPNLTITATDGTLVASKLFDPTMTCGQDKALDIPISHDCRLLITDTGGGGCDFAWCGMVSEFEVISDVQDIGAGANLDFRPTDGYEVTITLVGGETWTALGAPADVPNMSTSNYNGTNASQFLKAGPSFLWDSLLDIKINNTNRLRLNNSAGGNSELSFFGYVTRKYKG